MKRDAPTEDYPSIERKKNTPQIDNKIHTPIYISKHENTTYTPTKRTRTHFFHLTMARRVRQWRISCFQVRRFTLIRAECFVERNAFEVVVQFCL